MIPIKEGPSIIESFNLDSIWQDVEVAKCKYCKSPCSVTYNSGIRYTCPVCRHSREREDIYYITERQEVKTEVSGGGWIIKQWMKPKLWGET